MRYFFILFLIVSIAFINCKNNDSRSVDFRSISPLNSDSTINMIVEIPTGTTAKYEMDKTTYTLLMDSINGKPRYIDYLGYPANYGMIPNTILSKDEGGDGDPLDILLLGPAVKRGSVEKVKVIGVLELLDNGEQDDKLIAINPATNWSKVEKIEDLDKFYPGTKTIIASFFENYKGKGKMQLTGWSGKSRAIEILNKSIPLNKWSAN